MKKIGRIIYIFIGLYFLSYGSHAEAADTAKTSFIKAGNCVREGKKGGCSDYITQGSKELYKRFSSYDLEACLPKNINYISEQKLGKYIWVKAEVIAGNSSRYANLAFVKEKGRFLLDIPQSMQRAIGGDWEKRLEMTERIYVMLKQQTGGKLDCSVVQSLAMANKK